MQIPVTAYTPDRGRWVVGLYDALVPDQPQLAITSATGAATGAGTDTEADDRALRFGAVTIATPPGTTPNPVDVAFGDNVTLAGYTFSRRRVHAGDAFTVTLYWRARGPSPR